MSVDKIKADLTFRLSLVSQSQGKFWLRRLTLSFSKILPSPLRHKIKIWWNNLLTKNQVEPPRPLKIAVVMNNFVIGGVEKLLYDIIVRLDKSKFQVAVVTIFGIGPLEAKFRELNIPIYLAAGETPFFTDKWWYKIWWIAISPLIFIRLLVYLGRYRPAVVVTSLYQADILGISAGWLLRVKKRILIHHDVYPIGPVKAWLKKTFGVNLATKVVAVSQTAKNFVVSYFAARPVQVQIIHNGIDVTKFPINHPLPVSAQLVVGMLGRLEPVKGPAVFVESLRILYHKFHISPTSFIAGDGGLKTELENYAQQNRLSELVFDGEVRNVPEWFSKIDILVVPSRSEGFGLVVLEGLAANKIVVASDLPAIRELIVDGENGCLFPNGSSEKLADTLWRLLMDRELLERVRAGTALWRQQFLPNYDISRVVQSYEDLFLSDSDDQTSVGQIKP